MGCCLSKKKGSSLPSSPPAPIPIPIPPSNPKNPSFSLAQNKNNISATVADPAADKENIIHNKNQQQQHEEQKQVKKEVFVIQHRKSTDHKRPDSKCPTDSSSDDGNIKPASPGTGTGTGKLLANGGLVRASSCTKDEVDAILIQCGRLSRRSSSFDSNRKCSGSNIEGSEDGKRKLGGDLDAEGKECGDEDRSRRRRESRGSPRRRTPSRSRERDSQQQQQRSESSERRTTSGRRVSRSPGRRSESPVCNVSNGVSETASNGTRPGRMVSVPATVSSLSNDKGAGGPDATAANGNVKRVLVKRNVGEASAAGTTRGTVSPRSQSPARGNGGGISNPRKKEHSPYRRTPLNDIDMNSLPFNPLANNSSSSKAPQKTKDVDENKCIVPQGTHRRTGSRCGGDGNEMANNISFCIVTNDKGAQSTRSSGDIGYDAVVTSTIISGSETLRLPQTLTRSRSARRSRDLDVDVEALLNQNGTSNYNSLLLQDIQNFHQNNNTNANPIANAIANANNSTPPCLSKACSIIEAVADLNSSTSSNLSGASSSDKQKSTLADLSIAKHSNFGFSANQVGKRRSLENNDPFVVESQVSGGGDHLMAPSIHKYITVRNKVIDDDEGQESSGSNSFVGSRVNWTSSSWEPNSADSTDCWTSSSSRSNTAGKEGSIHKELGSAEPLRRNEEGHHKKSSKSSKRESPSEQRTGTTACKGR